ncbi:MAG: DUF4290 domain-containing protein [Flavobacteriales bacterium]|nr:DUF4290 domain-containing protein [Flavobacteriales bacterium]MCW8912607.1 DUF4290 domain-containing protein [Flavobacteriales bacterium]MCW8938212.1 DUF4290 domain-containing protein [Flavobacteriales bacterium]MCW8939999.1 DUF4290 domain-containing protein [Flavobacteriales bacterium]MCW8966996.1 DUF4290 domain-containing protein [Flavobacteriales bacterium]
MQNIEKDYNTRRPKMVIPEYGRNIQKMIDHAMTVENKEERNKIANAIISVMGQLNPHLRDIADFKHKLWDHLFIISDFKLDVDSPYPLPDREAIAKKPEKLAYPENNIRFKHYGKTIENLIDQAILLEEKEEKNALIRIIANLMKKTYLTFNRDSVNDELIIADLKTLSQGKLQLENSFEFLSTDEILSVDKTKRQSNTSRGKKNNNQRSKSNFKKRRY